MSCIRLRGYTLVVNQNEYASLITWQLPASLYACARQVLGRRPRHPLQIHLSPWHLHCKNGKVMLSFIPAGGMTAERLRALEPDILKNIATATLNPLPFKDDADTQQQLSTNHAARQPWHNGLLAG